MNHWTAEWSFVAFSKRKQKTDFTTKNFLQITFLQQNSSQETFWKKLMLQPRLQLTSNTEPTETEQSTKPSPILYPSLLQSRRCR